MSLAGSFAGTGLRAVTAVAAAARARVMFFSRPGMRAFLAAGVRPGSASRAARPRSAAASVLSASRTAALAWSRAGLRISFAFVSVVAR